MFIMTFDGYSGFLFTVASSIVINNDFDRTCKFHGAVQHISGPYPVHPGKDIRLDQYIFLSYNKSMCSLAIYSWASLIGPIGCTNLMDLAMKLSYQTKVIWQILGLSTGTIGNVAGFPENYILWYANALGVFITLVL